MFIETMGEEGGINKGIEQIYLDVEEADTKIHLEAIKNLPIHTYKLSYERGGQGRTRVGPVGPEVSVTYDGRSERGERSDPQ